MLRTETRWAAPSVTGPTLYIGRRTRPCRSATRPSPCARHAATQNRQRTRDLQNCWAKIKSFEPPEAPSRLTLKRIGTGLFVTTFVDVLGADATAGLDDDRIPLGAATPQARLRSRRAPGGSAVSYARAASRGAAIGLKDSRRCGTRTLEGLMLGRRDAPRSPRAREAARLREPLVAISAGREQFQGRLTPLAAASPSAM